MRFSLRDDDTNFFTTPDDLDACYQGIWETVPPSLGLISKIKGDWPKWLLHIYRNKQHSDWDAWRRDDHVYPIEQNTGLIQYLREKLAKQSLDVFFHAKHHRNEDTSLPPEMSNNYVRGAEFFTNRDLTEYIRTEVEHLSELLGYRISAFTPPQNLLSLKGYRAVINAGLNVCGAGISFYHKEKTVDGLLNMLRQGVFKLKGKHREYPYVLRYKTHSEIVYHYPLQPNTDLKELISQFEMVRAYDGDFVLSTHYAEFFYPMVYRKRRTMKDVLLEFLEHIARYDVEYLTLSELLNQPAASRQPLMQYAMRERELSYPYRMVPSLFTQTGK